MSTPANRQSRRRLATRQAISDAATKLFIERGFDHVTVDDIAAAADVGRMTVFNHFPRKEDMFFDRDEEGRDMLRQAIRLRGARMTAIEALRRFAHRLVAERSPVVEFSGRSRSFVEAIAGSEVLKARARAIRDEFAQVVATELAESVGKEPDDGDARLAAGLLLATWTAAFVHAHRLFRQSGSASEASTGFLAVVERGSAGTTAAMAGTPYA